jgi:amino acid transporter
LEGQVTGSLSRAEEALKQEIGRLGYSAITLNGVIGAGIFGLPAIAAARAGAFSPWMFLLCGVLILTVVLSFARASSFFHNTGGPIVYASHAFGPFVGFQTGWIFYLSRVASMAANTNLLVTYASWYWPNLNSGWTRAAGIIAVMVSLTALNIIGVRRGMITIYVLTFLKILPLFLLILLGLPHLGPENLISAELPSPGTLGETILILLYAFVGFEGAVVPAGEGRNPRRDIPRALTSTVVMISLLYFLIQAISFAVTPNLASSETPLADAAQILMGTAGAALLTLGAVFSISGNVSASMLSTPRMTYALARDGVLPSWFSHVSPRFHTPSNSVLFYGAMSLVLALSGTFIWLAAMSTLVRVRVYGMCIASLPRLENRIGEHEGQYRLPGGWLVPVIALLLCLWLVTQASMTAWLTALAFIALGSVLYATSHRSRSGDPDLA